MINGNEMNPEKTVKDDVMNNVNQHKYRRKKVKWMMKWDDTKTRTVQKVLDSSPEREKKMSEKRNKIRENRTS